MLTVLNTLKLFFLLGLGLLYFIGLGSPITELLFHGSSKKDRKYSISLLQLTPLTITFGIVFNYGISLAFQSLSTGLISGIIISVLGLWRLGIRFSHNHHKYLNEPLGKWFGTVFVCFLFFSLILFEPLVSWDARSIWFFHAKMIYYAETFGALAGWQHPSVEFSHVDYPNLVPGIAAQIGYILGYWNEYIPKISLIFILAPIIMWLFTFANKSFTFIILILISPFSIYLLTWNGYMDGYLALYLSVSMLLLGRYIQHKDPIDLFSSILCMIILIYLKNEGQLAMLSGITSLVIAHFFMRNKSYYTGIKSHLSGWRKFVVGMIILLPYILWSFYRLNYDLSNDLQIGTAQSINRLIERINDNSVNLILEHTYEPIEDALRLLGMLYFAKIALKQSIPKIVIPSLTTAAIYYLGILFIYFITPHNLEWHLNTSVDRTILSVAGCIYIACYFILDSLESLTTN